MKWKRNWNYYMFVKEKKIQIKLLIIATNANYMRGKEAINELCESMTHARL